LGHPRIFINVDKPQICSCTYCGLPFVCTSLPVLVGFSLLTEPYRRTRRTANTSKACHRRASLWSLPTTRRRCLQDTSRVRRAQRSRISQTLGCRWSRGRRVQSGYRVRITHQAVTIIYPSQPQIPSPRPTPPLMLQTKPNAMLMLSHSHAHVLPFPPIQTPPSSPTPTSSPPAS